MKASLPSDYMLGQYPYRHNGQNLAKGLLLLSREVRHLRHHYAFLTCTFFNNVAPNTSCCEHQYTIHEERVVHSDLKLANFLLVKGSLKVIDFGIAKAIMSDTKNIQRDLHVFSYTLSFIPWYLLDEALKLVTLLDL